MKHLLITTRDYPYKNLDAFSLVPAPQLDSFIRDSFDIILSERDKNRCQENNQEWAQKKNASDEEKNADLFRRFKWTSIDIVFRHDRAPWTRQANEPFFTNRKKEGIPIVRLDCKDTKVYILPCTAIGGLDLTFRHNYTAACIEAICSVANISMTALYAVIHSGDIYDQSNSVKARLVSKNDTLLNSTLSDLVSIGHVYHFHHESTEAIDSVYDRIVKPATLSKSDEVTSKAIDDIFTSASEENEWRIKIWEGMRSLNKIDNEKN